MENDFLGTGWTFPPTFYGGGADVEMVQGEEDIKQSLQILLSTSLRERVMQADYGCELSWFLFEEINQGSVSELQRTVERAIGKHEPRVVVQQVSITEGEPQVLMISIDYRVRTTNNRFNLVYPFYINEASVEP